MTELPQGLHGAFRRSELAQQIGLPAVRELQRAGRLVRFSRNVLVDRRHMLALRTRAAAALLYVGPRAVIASHTAALIYGCSAADAGAIHVLRDDHRELPDRPEIKLRQGDYDDADVLELDGLRTLALEIVLAELLCTVHRPVALACADQAMALLDPGFRESFRLEVAKRLRQRTDLLGPSRGEILLHMATGLPESPAESGMLLALYDAGLPIPSLQHPVHDITGRERYCLDFAWEEPRVALEYDGWAAHESRAAADAARDTELRSRGWTVFHATATDLHDPTRLVRTLASALQVRRYVA